MWQAGTAVGRRLEDNATVTTYPMWSPGGVLDTEGGQSETTGDHHVYIIRTNEQQRRIVA
jgi:hypothetical protein